MRALLYGEWLKLRRQRMLYVVLVVLFVLTVAIGAYQVVQEPPSVSGDWRQSLTKQIEQLEKKQQELSPGTIMYDVNRERIILYRYQLEHDIPPDPESNVWDFLSSTSYLMTLAGFYLIAMSVYIVASEYQQGTIKFLFLKPTPPLSVMIAKWLTITGLLAGITVYILVLSWLVGAVLFGVSGPTETLVVTGDEVIVQHAALSELRRYALSAIGIWIMCSGAFALACVIRSVAVATAVSLLFYYSGELVTGLLAARFDWIKYVLFANTNLNVYFEGRPPVEGMSLTFSIILLFVYMLLFAALVFRSVHKKDVPLS